jgi:aspartate racemase
MEENFSTRTIGVLGGMGPAATAKFHQLLVAELNKRGVKQDSHFPKIISLSIPLQDWNETGALDKYSVRRQIQRGLNWLESLGAEIIAVPCNTVHEFVDSTKVVNIVDATMARIAYEPVGVVCSRQTRDSALYDPGRLYCADQSAIDNTIAAVLTGARPDISPMLRELMDQGAETIVIGCTELSLCQYYVPLIVILDALQILAEEVVARLAFFL